jgi:hypothetical protein
MLDVRMQELISASARFSSSMCCAPWACGERMHCGLVCACSHDCGVWVCVVCRPLLRKVFGLEMSRAAESIQVNMFDTAAMRRTA